MGSIFVSRQNKGNTVEKVQERLDEWKRLGIKRHFLIFPEGTTTNSHYLGKRRIAYDIMSS